MKNKIRCICHLFFIGFCFLNSTLLHAENNQITIHVPMSYEKVFNKLNNQLQRCVAKKANLLMKGIKIQETTIDNISILNIKSYEFGDAVDTQFGSVLISKGKKSTLVKVTNQPRLFSDLHLTQLVPLWLKGNTDCSVSKR